jgi:peptide/nickel transport system substrate-binding protein
MIPKRSTVSHEEFVMQAAREGLSRREIVRRATLLGFSLPVINGMVSGGASAAGEAPRRHTTSRSSLQAAEPSGNVIISLPEEPLTLENWNAFSANGHPILRNVMEALCNRDAETNELIPELALSWERTNDTTWQFKLREGVTFHNGEEFNAEVAAYGLNYTWDPENAFEIRAIVGPEMTATAVDTYTLDVTTEAPDPILPTRLYFSPIPSMTQIQEDPESAKDKPIGTGPYTFVEWLKGQHVRLTANPEWWGHGADDAAGTVTIQDVEIQFRQESTVRAAQISTGEAHLTHSLSEEDCDAVPVCAPALSTETDILRLDTMHVAMSNLRVRQAIAYATPIQAITEELFIGEPAAQIYGPMALGFNQELEPYPYDMEEAARLIEEARADGVPVDAPLTLITTGTAPHSTELVQLMAEQLKQIGLDASSQVLDAAQYRPQVFGTSPHDVPEERGWIVLIGHGNELMDASASSFYFSCAPDSNSTYCNEDIVRLTEEAAKLEGEARDEAFQEIGAILYEDVPFVPIEHRVINYGMVEDLVWTPRLDRFMLVKEMSFQS